MPIVAVITSFAHRLLISSFVVILSKSSIFFALWFDERTHVLRAVLDCGIRYRLHLLAFDNLGVVVHYLFVSSTSPRSESTGDVHIEIVLWNVCEGIV
jgi:hypothetical protein